MEIEKFAPVIIPTLCRFSHFKVCIESLMNCTHSEKTDVFIGLDYPAKEEHWEGYKKIYSYLKKLETNNKFKSLTIIKRNHNFGFGKNGNSANLRKYVLEKYDRYIYSEDDNQFSPAFLDFMNKCLTKYEDDKTVFAVCGYRHFFEFRYGDNTFFRQNIDFNAWGYGSWKNRINETEGLNALWFKKRLNRQSFNKIRLSNGNDRAFHFVSFAYSSNELLFSDIVLSIYIFLEGFDVIMPRISMVRNLGMDKSGENFHNIDSKTTQRYNDQEIFMQPIFELVGDGFDYYETNRKVYKKEGLGNFSNLILIKKLVFFFSKKLISHFKHN